MGIEMCDLAGRMNTGISSPRADTFNRFIGDKRQRLVQAGLNARRVGLILPPVIIRAVVFNADGQAVQNYPNPASSC